MTLTEARVALRRQWTEAVAVGARARDAVRARAADAALTHTRGNVAQAAELLRMDRSNLKRFLRSMDIDADNYRR